MACYRPARDEDFARRKKKLSGAEGAVDRAPVVEARHPVELHVVHVEFAVEVVVGEFFVSVHLADHVFRPAPIVQVVQRAEASHFTEPLLRQVHRQRFEGGAEPLVAPQIIGLPDFVGVTGRAFGARVCLPDERIFSLHQLENIG